MAITKKNKSPSTYPLLFAGILLILLPIFTFMTLDRFKRQEEFSTQRLLGRGISLIRTFEAGTRTGFFTMGWGAKRIQIMLFETSLQPEIIYMMITSKNGKILAHSDASMVGKSFEDMPIIEDINKNIPLFDHRVRLQNEQTSVFEVFKKFTPISRKLNGRHMQRHSMLMHNNNKRELHLNRFDNNGKGWCQPYFQSQDKNKPGTTQNYIFAGLSMEEAKIAKTRLLKQTIWSGFFFFIFGCAGFIALFAFQRYRSAQAYLTQIKAFSNNVIENMPSGLITMNLDHEITSMNRAAKNILGVDLSCFLPQLIELIKKPEFAKGIINQEITFVIEPDTFTDKISGKKLYKSIDLDMTTSIIKDSEDNITGFLFLFKDLTQEKKLTKRVETNKRLAAIGKLAAGVAHEIRNPLSSIKGFATYFGKQYKKTSSDRQTANIMVKEVERINKSITQLLEFAKPMNIDKKAVNINDLIEHSLKLVHHDIVQKKIKTNVDINLKTPIIYTDGQKMNQVLLNLYINAIQSMKENGKLEISVREKELEGLVEIRVKDNGIGMDKKIQDQIFDPYFTTRSTGTGLGLSIVHAIIENMRASISVQSTKGKGSCFIINLEF